MRVAWVTRLPDTSLVDLKPGLRAEFLLPGLATMLAFVAVAQVAGSYFGMSPTGAVLARVPDRIDGIALAVLFATVTAPVAYLVGICVVMLAYSRIARQQRQASRQSIVEGLRDVYARSDMDPLPGSSDNRERAMINVLFANTRIQTPEELRPIDSIALDHMSDYALSELEYRRGLRQLASGLLPAALTLCTAGTVARWEELGTGLTGGIIIRGCCLAIGVATYRAIRDTVEFQEGRRQQLLLHTAFRRLWQE